ncbi:MAG: hypothetical protein NT010_04605 [Proteobacteria bacterium]|nr:hypothetical protein [Pseudomonadota bacterium]
MKNNLRLTKIVVPENPEDYYFVTFTSGEHETEEVVERHDIDVEVMVEGKMPLSEVESVAKERATKFVKALAGDL